MFATLAFTGMRIGELKQPMREDVDLDHNVIHVHRRGSGGKPKDKEDRFIPIHPRKLGPVLRTLPRTSEQVFLMPGGRSICEKKLRRYLKNVCEQCGLHNPQQYKLHTFRHFFASYCAQQNLSYKYVLEWRGHSSSAILDVYFTMNDRHAQAAMNSLSFDSEHGKSRTVPRRSGSHSDQTLPQVSHVQTVTITPRKLTERAGFEPAVPNGHTGFRNQLDQPLRHLSIKENRVFAVENGALVHGVYVGYPWLSTKMRQGVRQGVCADFRASGDWANKPSTVPCWCKGN
jgi:hypothetical protein